MAAMVGAGKAAVETKTGVQPAKASRSRTEAKAGSLEGLVDSKIRETHMLPQPGYLGRKLFSNKVNFGPNQGLGTGKWAGVRRPTLLLGYLPSCLPSPGQGCQHALKALKGSCKFR